MQIRSVTVCHSYFTKYIHLMSTWHCVFVFIFLNSIGIAILWWPFEKENGELLFHSVGDEMKFTLHVFHLILNKSAEDEHDLFGSGVDNTTKPYSLYNTWYLSHFEIVQKRSAQRKRALGRNIWIFNVNIIEKDLFF